MNKPEEVIERYVAVLTVKKVLAYPNSDKFEERWFGRSDEAPLEEFMVSRRSLPAYEKGAAYIDPGNLFIGDKA